MLDMVKLGEGMFYDPNYEELEEQAKPCPFCGCKYIKRITRAHFEALHTRGLNLECLDCECEMWWFPKDPRTTSTFDEATAECLKLWNRRCAA